MSLKVQLLLLQAVIVCLATLITGVIAVTLQERAIRTSYQDRMIAVAQSVARQQVILDALDDADPAAVIQPVAELIRQASDVTYVVVTDADGIRLSHPDPDRIGEPVSTDPSVPLSGETFVGTQEGTLGVSWRVKVPIFADVDGGDVVGTVSVGILESEISAQFLSQVPWLLVAMGASAVIGVFGAAWVTSVVRKRIFRLEPGEIATLVEQRETVLHRIGEGIITVDEHGVITTANDAAARLLGDDDLVGRTADEALEPAVADVLRRGEPDGALVLVGERVLIARSTGTVVDGEATAATLLLRDHTELHQALREMDGAQSLTDGLRAQAHEFANTMHVLSGLLELGLVDDAREFIAGSSPGGAMGDGETRPVLGQFELSALLAVKTAQAREVGITLEVRRRPGDADDVPRLSEDVGHDLVTIVGNLVDNAVEACGLGDRVEVCARMDDGMIVVAVDDSGPGVPEDERARIFVEGVSSKAPAGARGPHRRGIGLALVRRVVRRRRGDVSVTDSPLGGARFVVRLPIDAPSPTTSAHEAVPA
ncbi:ATP-binding protein [Microbacterium ureisolvens]|uniref:histidine kinase n=1 Tax=Microbacterium ureisolvens TaxID=2781186 RepID=A0ABS7I2Y0_9MICO|nr:sensor histidine kinase [Microbacterium ureisolvens]MBW9111700.1 sensor histidine kinase [Microbacterium ureisolvens]